MVRPWKELFSVTMAERPLPYLSKLYFRASLIRPSLASPPPLAKKTQLMPVRLQRISASRAGGSVQKRLEAWPRRWACRAMASAQAWLPYPRSLTPMPLVKSM